MAAPRAQLGLLGAVLAASIVLAAVYGLLKYQGLFINFPMRLRWTFHRQMLEQSMVFYQDEFAGRIATKVMQTALAVRDTWMIFGDILVYVGVYFATLLGVVGSFDPGCSRRSSPGSGCTCWRSVTSCRAWPRWPRRRPTRAR